MNNKQYDLVSNRVLLNLALLMLRDLNREDGVITYEEIVGAETIIAKAHDKYIEILMGFNNE